MGNKEISLSLITAENFVDIVGYQLEKTHTGVIAWLLDSERSPLPTHEQAVLLGKLAPDLLKGKEFTSTKAIREYSFGRSLRIDLVLEIVLKDQTKICVLIECKTDSDVSVKQLEKTAEAFSANNPNVPFSVIALAVGAGQFTLMHQLHDIQRLGFHAIDVRCALEIFSSLSIAGTTRTYDDWIASLQAELTRSARIDTALAGLNDPWNIRLVKTGYRTGFPVFYMFYDRLREFLNKEPFQGWGIYSGRNNPVLNWREGWITRGSENDAIGLYWEFNWDTFRLKAEVEKHNAACWEHWQRIRPRIVELCATCPIAGRSTANRRGTWVTAYKWKFDFCKEEPVAIARKTADILSHLHKHLQSIT